MQNNSAISKPVRHFKTIVGTILLSLPLWYAAFNLPVDQRPLHENTEYLVTLIVIGFLVAATGVASVKTPLHMLIQKLILVSIMVGVAMVVVGASSPAWGGNGIMIFGNVWYTVGFWIYVAINFFVATSQPGTGLSSKKLEVILATNLLASLFIAVTIHVALLEAANIYADTISLYFITFFYINTLMQLRHK